MGPPRRHYGPKPPGRLDATMLKVLAAELSDAGRLGRGKRLFEQDAVTDIDIQPGRVDVVVQGSRPDPYEVMLATRPGDGIPSGSEVAASCSCPDAERVRLCKHAVAGLFALASEVAIEPELMSTWRGGARPTGGSDAGDDDRLAPVIPLFEPELDPGHSGQIDDGEPEPEYDETSAEINSMLLPPNGHGRSPQPDLAVFEPVTPIRQRSSGNPNIDRMLAEIYAELDLGW